MIFFDRSSTFPVVVSLKHLLSMVWIRIAVPSFFRFFLLYHGCSFTRLAKYLYACMKPLLIESNNKNKKSIPQLNRSYYLIEQVTESRVAIVIFPTDVGETNF